MLLIFESLIVGLISLIIGNIMMYYTSNKEEFQKKKVFSLERFLYVELAS